MENKQNRIRIYSYNKVWKMENRIYAIQNIVLPVPIKPREILYFMITAGVVFILSIILPFFGHIPTILRYVALPYGATQFLLKKKLDGKLPQKYFIEYIKYIATKKIYVERFQTQTGKTKEKIKISWLCSTRS